MIPMANTPTARSLEMMDETEMERLIVQLEQDALSTDEKARIIRVLRSYYFAARLLKEAGTKLKTIRDFFSEGAQKQRRP
ncbi:hypothetical protein HDN1F_01970 [gamma proteobacterium HdN1]|nr:hypothetical protein HDN1F_01970 [gamma proteobacterium HdN1]